MQNKDPRVGEQRPGGRAARVRSDVLGATSQLLMEVGYDEMSVEDVATRAGVHKTTVYRRWPTKPELVAAAVSAQAAENVPVPDTGSTIGDLQAFAREIIANIGSEGGSRQTRSLVAAGATSDELAATMHAMWAQRLSASATIVERAVERGELPPGSDPNLIIETLIGPIWVRLLLTGEPIDDDLANRVALLVMQGAAHATNDEPSTTPSPTDRD